MYPKSTPDHTRGADWIGSAPGGVAAVPASQGPISVWRIFSSGLVGGSVVRISFSIGLEGDCAKERVCFMLILAPGRLRRCSFPYLTYVKLACPTLLASFSWEQAGKRRPVSISTLVVALSRSSSREVRIRVPTFSVVYFSRSHLSPNNSTSWSFDWRSQRGNGSANRPSACFSERLDSVDL